MLARLKLLRRLTGAFGVPADLRRSELFWHEPDGALGIGVGAGTGDLAASGVKLLQSDGDRIWHEIVGAADGSTQFVGVGSALTGITPAQVGAVAEGDARLTNAREWTAATISQAEAEAGTATTRRAFTAQRARQAGLTSAAAWWAASASKTKLDGIAAGATANASDAHLLDRANHTGTQAASTITGLATVATTGAYADLSGLPSLFDGAWASLSGVPSTFPPDAHGHGAGDITGLATVATSGAYADLSGLPALFSGVFADLTSKPTTLAGYGITDAVTSGSNANGVWYDIGGVLRLCISPVIGSASTTADGNVFRSGNVDWTFPAAFATATPLAAGFALTNSENAWSVVRALNSTTLRIRIITATSVATARNGRAWAIGLI